MHRGRVCVDTGLVSNRGERQSVAAAALASASVALTVAGVAATRAHFSERIPFAPWTGTQTVIWSIACVSSLVTALGGAWLVHRLPLNPTGWWVLATALAFSLWMLGGYWPGAFSPWAMQLLPIVFTVTMVIAVLKWPTGRLERRWAEPFTVAVVVYVVVGVTAELIGYRPSMWAAGDWRLPSHGDFLDGLLAAMVAALVLHGVAPVVFFAAVLRRHRMMPSAVRASTLPALLGAAVLAFTEVWIFAFDLVLAPLNLQNAPSSRIADISGVITVGRFGVVAGLLVVAEAVRRLGARRAVSERRVELGEQVSVDVSAEVSRILNDETARLVVCDGPRAQRERAGRASIELVDARGAAVAVVDHDADIVVTPAMRDALLSAVELDVIRRAREVEARGRTVRELLDDLMGRFPALRSQLLADDELAPFVNVYVEGEDVRTRDGLETSVDDGSTVILLPAMAGG